MPIIHLFIISLNKYVWYTQYLIGTVPGTEQVQDLLSDNLHNTSNNGIKQITIISAGIKWY